MDMDKGGGTMIFNRPLSWSPMRCSRIGFYKDYKLLVIKITHLVIVQS